MKKRRIMYRDILIKISVAIMVIFTVVAEGQEAIFTPERILEIESQIELPPDPGPNGEALLNGYDIDGDGIRDDIQRYIEIKYWEQPKFKALYYDYARATLNVIAAADKDRETILNYSNVMLNTSRCVSALNKRDKARGLDDDLKEFKLKIVNTIERMKVYFKANAKLSGIYSGESLETYIKHCEKYGFQE